MKNYNDGGDPTDTYAVHKNSVPEELDPERKLWWAVLEGAVIAYLSKKDTKEAERERWESEHYLFRDSTNTQLPGFEAVCEVLGFSSSALRSRLLKLKQEGVSLDTAKTLFRSYSEANE